MDIWDLFKRGDPRDRFTERVTARLRERGWTRPLSYDRERFEIDLGGEEGRLYLGHVFSGTRGATPWKRTAWIDEALDVVFDPDDAVSYEAAEPLLIPTVFNRTIVGTSYLAGSGRLDGEIRSGSLGPLGDVLVVKVARRRADGARVATARQLAIWGVSGEQVLPTAIANLRANTVTRFEKGPDGGFITECDDGFHASRLLLPELFEALPLRGRPVVVALAQSYVLVTGSEDPVAQRSLAEHVFLVRSKEKLDFISMAPLVLTEAGVWEPYLPTGPDYAPARGLATNQRIHEYRGQAHLLQEHLQWTGEDLALGPADWMEDGDEMRTFTYWEKARPTLLPRSDAIVLAPEQGQPLVRLWEDVEAVCGPFSIDARSYPPRRLARDWPEAEAWERLSTAYKRPAWAPSPRRR